MDSSSIKPEPIRLVMKPLECDMCGKSCDFADYDIISVDRFCHWGWMVCGDSKCLDAASITLADYYAYKWENTLAGYGYPAKLNDEVRFYRKSIDGIQTGKQDPNYTNHTIYIIGDKPHVAMTFDCDKHGKDAHRFVLLDNIVKTMKWDEIH